MAHDEHAHAKHSARPYIFTVIALFCFTILTYTLAQQDFGPWNFVIAMCIAACKAMLVILFFMHLWDQPGPNRLTLAIAVLFVVLLIVLACADVHTRFPLALPPGSFRALH